MECSYCKKTYLSKQSLQTHQKSAKFCLKLQNKIPTEESTYKCEYCNDIFTTKHRCETHQKSCSIKSSHVKILLDEKDNVIKTLSDNNSNLAISNTNLCKRNKLLSDKIEHMSTLKKEKEFIISTKDKEIDSIISTKDKEIAVLQEALRIYKNIGEKSTNCVEEIAKQPKIQTTQTTQTTQNTQNNKLLNMKPLDLEDEKVKERMLGIATEFFGRDYFNEGQKGVARFTAEKLLRDTDGKLQYRCTDPSRQTFKFLTNNGDIRTDVRATLLSKLLDETVVKAFKAMVTNITPSLTSDEFLIFSENFMQINGLSSDNSDFRSELAALTANN